DRAGARGCRGARASRRWHTRAVARAERQRGQRLPTYHVCGPRQCCGRCRGTDPDRCGTDHRDRFGEHALAGHARESVIRGVLLFAQITIGEYAARRAALADSLPPDGVLVVQGAPEPTEDYQSFQQDPAFLYLTGVIEPDAALILTKHGPGILFV